MQSQLGRGRGCAILFKGRDSYISLHPSTSSPYTQFSHCTVLNLSVFSKFPAHAGEFALRRSPDNRPRVRLRALRLALLVLLTFVLCWTPYLLGLWFWFSPTMLAQVPPVAATSLFSLAFSMLLWILSSTGSALLAAKDGTMNTVLTPPGKEGPGKELSRWLKLRDNWKNKPIW